MCQKIKYEVYPWWKPSPKCSPAPPASNQGSCPRNTEWVLNCEDSQENRMMSIRQADVLQCLSWRSDAHEGIFHILLLSERTTNPFFSITLYCFTVFVMPQFYVFVDAFKGYLWFLQNSYNAWLLNSPESLIRAPAVSRNTSPPKWLLIYKLLTQCYPEFGRETLFFSNVSTVNEKSKYRKFFIWLE